MDTTMYVKKYYWAWALLFSSSIQYGKSYCVEPLNGMYTWRFPNTSVPFKPLLIVPDKISSSRELQEAATILVNGPGHLRVAVDYYNNNKDTLLIIGQGFPCNRTDMCNVARLFNDHYDVICFDYRWSQKGFFTRLSTIRNPIKEVLQKEVLEVETVVNYFRARKNYKQIIGLCMCYSCGTFAAAQIRGYEQNIIMFDKFIFDSCYLSLHDFVEQIVKDPLITMYPQSYAGGSPEWVQKFLSWAAIHRKLVQWGRALVPQYTLKPHLEALTGVPILLFHGIHDRLVPDAAFEEIWNAIPGTKKCAFTGPFSHTNFYQTNKNLYKKICIDFIATPDMQSLATQPREDV